MSLRSLNRTTCSKGIVIGRSRIVGLLLLLVLLLNTLGSAAMLACETSCCKSPATPEAAGSMKCHEQIIAATSTDSRLLQTHSTNNSTPERLLQCAPEAQPALSLQQEQQLPNLEFIFPGLESDLALYRKGSALRFPRFASPPLPSSQVSTPLRT
jgi:hypothetical protein